MTSKKRKALPRLGGRLYFFPALLPLMEVVPWLLTVIGGVAGVAGIADIALWKKHYKKIILVMFVCFAAAAAVVVSQKPAEVLLEHGTQAVPADKLPVPRRAPAAAITPPATINKDVALSEIWSRRTIRGILSTPIIAKDMLIYGTFGGAVEAVSIQDGRDIWSLKSHHEPLFALTQGAGDIIYAGDGLHETTVARLTALNAIDGTPLWQREFLGHIEDAPAIDDANHRLWLGAGPGGFWALDTKDGAVLWHKPLGNIASTPLVRDGVVYVAAQPDEKRLASVLYALDAKDGRVIWQASLPGQPWGSPDMDGEGKTIWITSGLGQINVTKPTDRGWATALSASDGKVFWQKKLPNMSIQPSLHLLKEGLLIYSIKTGEIVALHARHGEVAWSGKTGKDIQASAILLQDGSDPLLAITTFDGIFSIRRADTGEEVVRKNVPKGSTSSPVLSGDNIYITTPHNITALSGVHALLRAR